MYEKGAKIDKKTVKGEQFCKLWGKRTSQAFDRVFWDSNSPYEGVFPVNPAASHQKLHLQQGLFLCPVKVGKSFSDNLRDLSGHEKKVLKLFIRRDCRDDILLKLHRAGTNRELLFPGLDGFAQGLESRTPIIHFNLEKLSKNRARIPTNENGEFLFGEYYHKYCKPKKWKQ